MFQFQLNKLHETLPGLTQSYYTNAHADLTTLRASSATTGTQAQNWTHCLMATLSGDRFFQIGRGELDSVAYTRILEQYAYENGVEFAALADEFTSFIRRNSRDVTMWTEILTQLIGTTGKTVRKNMIIKILPAHILAVIKKRGFQTDHEIFHTILTDFVAGLLAPLGWIVDSDGFAFHVTRRNLFPTLLDVVNALHAYNVQRVLNSLATAKLGIFDELMRGDAVSVVPLAQAITNCLSIAAELASAKPDPYRVTRAVLHRLIRVWNPVLPDVLRPTERVLRTTGFEDARCNVSMFMVAQDALKGDNSTLGRDLFSAVGDYTDEEFSSYVMKEFYDAITSGSSYNTRRLDEAASPVGTNIAFDGRRSPVHIAIYEALRCESDVSAFRPVVASNDLPKPFRYLMVDGELSSKYTDALKSVAGEFDIKRLVGTRMESYESVAASQRTFSDSLNMTVILPSILERENAAGRPWAALNAVITGSSDSDVVSVLESLTSRVVAVGAPERESDDVLSGAQELEAVKRRAFDVYAYFVIMAAAWGSPAISGDMIEANGDVDSISTSLYLTWQMHTNVTQALGSSVIMGSIVETTEPLEAIAYLRCDVPLPPIGERAVQPPMMDKHEDSIHVWRWWRASHPIGYAQTYHVTLGDTLYDVTLTERDFLGLFMPKEKARFMKPVVAMATVQSWFAVWLSDLEFMQRMLDQTNDTLVRGALEGRMLQVKVDIFSKLISLAESGIGRRVMARIDQSLRDQLYKTGNLDEYSAVHTAVHRLRMRTTVGLWLVEMLGLFNAGDTARLHKEINDERAMHLALALVSDRHRS